MPQLPQEFNVANHEPAEERTIYPANKYIAEVVDADFVDTKDEKGQYVQVEYEFTECEQNGAYGGRHYWDTFNLVNNNATAVAIAEGHFTSFCIAIGKMVVKNTDELLNTPAIGLKIGVRKAKKQDIENGYPDDKNVTLAWIKLQIGTAEPTVSTPVKRGPAKTVQPVKRLSAPVQGSPSKKDTPLPWMK